MFTNVAIANDRNVVAKCIANFLDSAPIGNTTFFALLPIVSTLIVIRVEKGKVPWIVNALTPTSRNFCMMVIV